MYSYFERVMIRAMFIFAAVEGILYLIREFI